MMASVNRRGHTLVLALMTAFVVAVGAAPAWSARDMPWEPNVLFNRISVDEDIRDVFRNIVRQNGMEAVFRPGVEGTVSFEFTNMPLQGAFNKLIAENNLDFDYDPSTKLVTIYSVEASERVQDFVSLSSASFDEINSAYLAHDMGGEIAYDATTRTVLISGTRDEVTELTNLFTAIDRAANQRQQTSATVGAVQAAERESEAQRRLFERLFNQDVKVIPLRFANVASTTKIFAGEQVTVPGIEDTLRKLVGDDRAMLEALPDDLRESVLEASPDIASGVFVSADPRTNSVIVRGAPEEIANVETLVSRLDQPVPMIELEVMIVNATKGFSESLGFEYAYETNNSANGQQNDNIFGFNSGISSADPNAVTDGLTGGANEAVPAIATGSQSLVLGFVYKGLLGTLQAQIQAFEQDNKAQTIAAPSVVTTNNVPATVRDSDTEIVQTTNAAAGINTFEEIDAGLELTITPSVVPRRTTGELDLVRLVVAAQNTAIAAGSAGGSASTTGQEIQTEVIIPNGRTFIMGGLADDSRTDNNRNTPLLGDLPFIGDLFDTTSAADTFEETLFFITPRIRFPEDIKPRDIAAKRYLDSRRLGFSAFRSDMRGDAAVLSDRTAYQEEDE